MDAEKLFKTLVWDALVKAALAELFMAAPYLAWGPLGWLIGVIVTYFADQMYAEAKMAIDLEVIAFKNIEHRKAFDDASLKLKILAHDLGEKSDEFQKALDEEAQALARFVHLGA